jgi:hypothetical protein
VCINGEGCCSTRDECFKGFLSNLTLPFYYFDHEPTQTKSWARLSSDRNAHTFAHQQHDYSDVDHAHVVRVDTPTETFRYIARSVKQNRDCTCVRGDFDCKCLSTAGLHEHVFFHEHDDAGIYHQHTVRVESPPIGLPMRSPTVSRFDDQIFSFYGAGANDELPEDFFLKSFRIFQQLRISSLLLVALLLSYRSHKCLGTFQLALLCAS